MTWIKGKVVRGLQNGRNFGFPTANVALDNPDLSLETGVFATEIIVNDKKYQGMLYVGTRPTLNLQEKSIEINIFGFNEDCYDAAISFEVLKKIRPDHKFDSKEDLIAQIQQDKQDIQAYFNSFPSASLKKIVKNAMLLCVAFILCSGASLQAQKNVRMGYDQQDNGVTYKSLDDALKNPEQVYRLKLVNKHRMDSLPEKLFMLTNLRELTVKGCKLNVLNQQISQLKKLVYLNVSCNHLVRLPESIGELPAIKALVISRNNIVELPNSIGNLSTLELIDAWDNPLYVLPDSISKLAETLKIMDLRQISIKNEEFEAMQKLLPKTNIMATSYCECSAGDRK